MPLRGLSARLRLCCSGLRVEIIEDRDVGLIVGDQQLASVFTRLNGFGHSIAEFQAEDAAGRREGTRASRTL
jgi:hypothetical protein